MTDMVRAPDRDDDAHLEHLRSQVEHLETALASSRQIGMAMGILMSRHTWTEDQAFTALREASQNRHLKLREVAAGVVLTGTLDDLPNVSHARAPGRRSS